MVHRLAWDYPHRPSSTCESPAAPPVNTVAEWLDQRLRDQIDPMMTKPDPFTGTQAQPLHYLHDQPWSSRRNAEQWQMSTLVCQIRVRHAKRIRRASRVSYSPLCPHENALSFQPWSWRTDVSGTVVSSPSQQNRADGSPEPNRKIQATSVFLICTRERGHLGGGTRSVEALFSGSKRPSY